MDGITPDCETEAGCRIPRLSPPGERVMQIRGLLMALAPTVDPGTVCRICQVDREDLTLLALIENELTEQRKTHGEGHSTDHPGQHPGR